MQYRFISASDIENSHLSFWQSSIWADILTDSGQARETFYFGEAESTCLLIEIRSIGLGFFGAFAIGVSQTQIGSDWQEYITELLLILRERGVLFFQIEPIDQLNLSNLNGSREGVYKEFLIPYTRTIDLTQSEDQILAQMHEKGRYNIRTAIKKGVQIEAVESTKENLDIWMRLLIDTLSRDSFFGNSRSYYDIFIRYLEQYKQGGLYFASFEGRVIAGGIFVFTPERAIYYYGASSSDAGDRKVFGSYLLQWDAIRIAKSRGSQFYDFLGVSKPGIGDDALAGVSFFKSRFGGEILELPKKIIFPLSWKYRGFRILQNLKKIIQH
ncbi:peptidoglycan bridge formation glycyltransferase FemA/FemB family protein [Candidatus Gracilibacteria bacterium]|nr:peptidoglycan bridge formation glycyltransferase FemA/FemB family protein [Candidatus Gracilibacteria bacterium]